MASPARGTGRVPLKVLLGIGGASGVVYGIRTGAVLLSRGASLSVIVTKTAWEILAAELPGPPPPASPPARASWIAHRMGASPDRCRLHADDDFSIPFVSGSNPPDAVVVAPCSMGLAGRIAHGISSNALERCADVALKERRPLLLVPRETPLSAIHLENLLALSRAGAEILPASPAFYHRPRTVEDIVDFVVSRVVSRLGVEARLHEPWGEGGTAAPGRAKRARRRPGGDR